MWATCSLPACTKVWNELSVMNHYFSGVYWNCFLSKFWGSQVLLPSNCHAFFSAFLNILTRKCYMYLLTKSWGVLFTGNWTFILNNSGYLIGYPYMNGDRRRRGVIWLWAGWAVCNYNMLLTSIKGQQQWIFQLPPRTRNPFTLHYWPINITLVCSCRCCY